MDHVDQLLDLFDLAEQGGRPDPDLSAGQKKKVALCSALVPRRRSCCWTSRFPAVSTPGHLDLEADHPSTTADRKDATIVLTSPVPELVEEIATRIIVLERRRDPGVRHARRPPADDRARGNLDGCCSELIFPDTTRKLDE